MNYGNNPFAHHWLYWQNAIELFNAKNYSGTVVNSPINATILKIAVSISAVVAVKRFVVGLYLGRQTFSTYHLPVATYDRIITRFLHLHNAFASLFAEHYGHELAKTMNKMVLVSEVAALAKEIEKAKMDHEQEKSVMSVPSA